MRDNLRKLRYYSFGVLCAGCLVVVVAYAPGTWSYAVLGLAAGVPLGFLYRPPRRKGPAWVGTALTLALIAGGLLGRIGRALIDENVINNLGAITLAFMAAWYFVVVSRYLMRERSA